MGDGERLGGRYVRVSGIAADAVSVACPVGGGEGRSGSFNYARNSPDTCVARDRNIRIIDVLWE